MKASSLSTFGFILFSVIVPLLVALWGDSASYQRSQDALSDQKTDCTCRHESAGVTPCCRTCVVGIAYFVRINQ